MWSPIPGVTFNCSAKHGYICVKPGGKVLPCCRWKDIAPPLDMFETFENILDYYQKIIHTPSKAWPKGCKACHLDVSSSRRCMMDVVNETVERTGNTIQYLEIGFDNVCNMNCVMCAAQHSSRWDKLVKDNKEFLSKYNFKEYNSPPSIYDNVMRLLESSDLSRLHTIKLMGGEPMYSKASLKFLEWFTNKDVSNIELFFSTNATIFPKKYLDLFKKFKRVIPKTSIDGINEIGEWGRNSDTPFKKIEEVVGLWNEYAKENNNIELRNLSTLTLVNIEHLGALSEWLKNYDQYVIRQMGLAQMNNYITPLALSRKDRQLLWQEQYILHDGMKLFENYETFLNAHQQEGYPVKKIIDYIEWYDTLNNNKFKDLSPKVWKIINNLYKEENK
jgi:organic radical activating enzyme